MGQVVGMSKYVIKMCAEMGLEVDPAIPFLDASDKKESRVRCPAFAPWIPSCPLCRGSVWGKSQLVRTNVYVCVRVCACVWVCGCVCVCAGV
jgi:hypothetical protein